MNYQIRDNDFEKLKIGRESCICGGWKHDLILKKAN
jgi:hypothetical protein